MWSNVMFSIFPLLFGFVFILVIGVFIISFFRMITTWSKNNNSPVLTVDAKVVTKRVAFNSHHHHHGSNAAMHHTSYSSTCFVTFQVESGDRIELNVGGSEYGIFVEGDKGRLTFQGTRYKGFQRI